MGNKITYQAAPSRYIKMIYNKCGTSGLKLPAVSLGLWHNFGDDTPHDTKRALCHTAFGDILKHDFKAYRDEMIISSKAGYLMWDGPYGE